MTNIYYPMRNCYIITLLVLLSFVLSSCAALKRSPYYPRPHTQHKPPKEVKTYPKKDTVTYRPRVRPRPSMIDSSKKSHLIDGWEKEFFQDQKFAHRYFQLSSFILQSPNEARVCGHDCQPKDGYQGYYEAEPVKKDQIVLHFTVGNLKSDINKLTPQKKGEPKWRVSVPFLVARDGQVIRLFNERYWSHHLGKGTIGGNEYSSKRSIAIELSNYGPLIKVGNNLETVYSRPKKDPNHIDVYCSLDETARYVKLKKPFKGYQYFATFTDEQYESLIQLLRILTEKYDIPREFLDESLRYQAHELTANFNGILSHLNFRPTGKWDIGPAFDWDRIIKGVQAPVYRPKRTVAFEY